MGDPAGIGPEITVKAIATPEVYDMADCIVIGSEKVLQKAIDLTNSNLKINVIAEPDERSEVKNILNLIDLDNVNMDKFDYGKVSAMCGQAAYDYIEKSIAELELHHKKQRKQLAEEFEKEKQINNARIIEMQNTTIEQEKDKPSFWNKIADKIFNFKIKQKYKN